MEITVTTPEGTKLAATDVDMLSIPTSSGEMGIMDDHVPMVTVVAAGEINVYRNKKIVENLAVSGGLLHVEVDSKVRILADTAELATEIDVDRAKAARERAEQFLLEAETIDFANVQLIQAKIEKELARERIGKRYRNIKNTP